MKRTLLSLWVATGLFCSFPMFSQTWITGCIRDNSSDEPIDMADVLLYETDRETAARQAFPDTSGRFRIGPVPAGNYRLTVRLIGYDVWTSGPIRSEGSAADRNVGTIRLKPLEIGIAEVEIVANRKQIVYKLDKKVVEASANLLAGGGSAADILENIPSVRVDAEGEVSFRGSTGFAVYVDGKPGVFSGTQALEQIPAGQIETVEIITAPSARHDTNGDVGIINIVTKKQTKNGLSGIVNATGSTMLSRGGDFLLTQRTGAFRWYGGGVWSEKLRKSDFRQEKRTVVDDLTTTSRSKGPRKSNNYNYALKAGGSYDRNRTSFLLDLEGGYGGRSRNGDLDYRESRRTNGPETEPEFYFSRDRYDLHETYGQGSVAFDHRFEEPGHTLSGRFYLKYGGDALEYFQSDLLDRQNRRKQGHRAWEAEHRWTVRGNLDYRFSYRKTGRIETGYQYHSYSEDGDYSMQFWDPEAQGFYWRNDMYNTFYFQEGVHSVYAIWAEGWGAFDLQSGVRGEHTHTELRSSVAGADRTKNRFELFPSAHLGYTFPGEHRLQLAYSRRTTRPELFFMEPYITYRDYYTAEIGNPDIRPEYIDAFELNYKKDFRSVTVAASLFHRSRKDKIERLRVPYAAGVTLDSMANVGHDFSTGVELNATWQATRFWNTRLNGNLYHYSVKNEREAGGKRESSTNYDILWNNGFDVAKYTRIQLDGNFVGPSVTTQGHTDAFWYVNLAVRQQFLQRSLTATLSFCDLFGSARYVSDIRTTALASSTHIRPDYPLITLSLSYTFNRYKSKTVRQREDHDLFEGTNH